MGVENKTGKAHAIELALSACAHVESRAEVGQLRDTRDWVSWLGDHLPPDMLCKHHPRVVAALLLHMAWCMEFGDGFPFAQCLVRVIESTRDGHTSCLPFTRQPPFIGHEVPQSFCNGLWQSCRAPLQAAHAVSQVAP